MFIHLITICVGLIIAFGLQQMAELYLRRRRTHKHQRDNHKPASGPDAP